MQGGVDGVEKTLVCVRGKIDGDLRSGCDRAGDFNVEHHFGIGIRIGARLVRSAVHANRDNLRPGDVEHFEIGPQVRRAESGAGDPALLVEVIQFNEGDALILAVQAGREVV